MNVERERESRRQKATGVFCTLASTFLLALVFLFARQAQAAMPGRLFMFWWFFAALLWSPLLFLLGRADWRSYVRTALRHWRFFLAYALIEGAGNVFFFHLVVVINPAVVSFFYSLSPFVGALLACFYLRERLGGREWAGGMLSVAGVLFITYVSPQVGVRHALYAVAMTVLYSWNNVLAKKYVADVPPLLITLGRILCLAVGFALVMAAGGGFRWPSANESLLIAAGTLCGPVFGMFLLFVALKSLPATLVFLLRNIQPFMVAALGALFLGLPFTGKQLAGGFIVVSGLVLMLLGPRPAAGRKDRIPPLSDPGE